VLIISDRAAFINAFSDNKRKSADSASKTVSILHQQKLIPNAAALRELLQQKPHLQQQFWELFQYDFALQDAMNHLSKN
jgi:hypothetical protein